jgi:hypothetical protein
VGGGGVWVREGIHNRKNNPKNFFLKMQQLAKSVLTLNPYASLNENQSSTETGAKRSSDYDLKHFFSLLTVIFQVEKVIKKIKTREYISLFLSLFYTPTHPHTPNHTHKALSWIQSFGLN